MSTDKIQWDSDVAVTAKVNIGTHSLSVSASGPAREPGKPIVLILPGTGCSAIQWHSVRALLDGFTRNIIYDRSGYGDSDEAPGTPAAISSQTSAAELKALLETANIRPPFILVAHSFSGIIAREFIHLLSDRKDVVGMVLVDARHEKASTFYGTPHFFPMIHGLNFHDIMGHTRNHKLPSDIWQALVDEGASARHMKTNMAELAAAAESAAMLGEKSQLSLSPPLLSDSPISVWMGNAIPEVRALYAAGIAAGNGTAEDRAAWETFLELFEKESEPLQREMLKLSTKSRLVKSEQAGHWVNLTQPEAVAEEVRWVLENLSSR